MTKVTNSNKDAISALKAGRVIIYPAESIYGIACCLSDVKSIKRIAAFKYRNANQGFIVIADEWSRVESLTSGVEKGDFRLDWPHNTTYVFNASKSAPCEACDTSKVKSVAIRISHSPVIKEICSIVGPIISTSANKRGYPPTQDLQQLDLEVFSLVDLILEAKSFEASQPSKIIDYATNKVIRN